MGAAPNFKTINFTCCEKCLRNRRFPVPSGLGWGNFAIVAVKTHEGFNCFCRVFQESFQKIALWFCRYAYARVLCCLRAPKNILMANELIVMEIKFELLTKCTKRKNFVSCGFLSFMSKANNLELFTGLWLYIKLYVTIYSTDRELLLFTILTGVEEPHSTMRHSLFEDVWAFSGPSLHHMD